MISCLIKTTFLPLYSYCVGYTLITIMCISVHRSFSMSISSWTAGPSFYILLIKRTPFQVAEAVLAVKMTNARGEVKYPIKVGHMF